MEVARISVNRLGIMIYELDWALGNLQWECPICHAVGNIVISHAAGQLLELYQEHAEHS